MCGPGMFEDPWGWALAEFERNERLWQAARGIPQWMPEGFTRVARTGEPDPGAAGRYLDGYWRWGLLGLPPGAPLARITGGS